MIKTGIVCGCLPTQAGIRQPDLYHQILAGNVFMETGKRLLISSAWYTTVAESRDKLIQLISEENPEIILYHVRPDPYLRVSKLLIRYRDHNDKFHILFNPDADDSRIREKKYFPTGSLPARNRSLLKIISRDINYIAGFILRVNLCAIRKEKKLLRDIFTVCRLQQIQLLLIGPASRPRSIIENYLLSRLEKKLAKEFKADHCNYISCFGSRYKNENLFMEDGVHISIAGHKRMAELITPVLNKILKQKFSMEAAEIS